MEYVGMLIVAAAVFAICFGVDKGFTKLFRGKPEHASGLAVKLNKFYALAGLAMFMLGVVSVFTGCSKKMMLLIVGGTVLLITAVCLIAYYLSFGVYYSEDTFLYTGIGKRSGTYRYADIQGQQLFNSGGHIVIELYLKDGNAITLQAGMQGVYPFLDTAFSGWLRQTGKRMEDCDFHDPANSCWFPKMGG